MTTFLLWNLRNQSLEKAVAALTREHRVSVVILVEASLAIATRVLLELNKPKSQFHLHVSPVAESGIFVLSCFPRKFVRVIRDSGRLSIRRIRPPIGQEFLLATLHFPSKMRLDASDQASLCSEFSRVVEEEENRVGHSRTILVGDFNMNPFESGMVSGHGFHAVNSRSSVQDSTRLISGFKSRRFFYNPMWRFMCDRDKSVAGTYHYRGSTPVEYFWHTFDQVLLRPSLLDMFKDTSVTIPTTFAGQSLLNNRGIPCQQTASDHLPVVFSVDIERI